MSFNNRGTQNYRGGRGNFRADGQASREQNSNSFNNFNGREDGNNFSNNSVPFMSKAKSYNNGFGSNATESKFKTVKCRNFEQFGSCNYGDKCSYAHGDQDLRGSKSQNFSYPSIPQIQ